MNKKQIKKGRPNSISELKLKEIALDIKIKLKGQKLTYLLLEKETGIGRHTWKRRIQEYINELNSPIIRKYDEVKNEIFFPNIEEIFERYKGNKLKIINELQNYESMFNQQYKELTELKEKIKKLEELPAIIEKQKNELIYLKNYGKHYELHYKELITASAFPHLRDEQKIKDNLISFENDIEKSTSLKEEVFEGMLNAGHRVDKDKKMKNLYPNLFD